MFSTLYDTYFSLSMHFKMSSAISFSLDQSKKFLSGDVLNTLLVSIPLKIMEHQFWSPFCWTMYPQNICMQFINTLPNGKILDLSEFKAHADGKIDVTQNFEFCFRKGKKRFGKRRKCLFQKCF